jgi:diphthamide biosynthesis protein 7
MYELETSSNPAPSEEAAATTASTTESQRLGLLGTVQPQPSDFKMTALQSEPLPGIFDVFPDGETEAGGEIFNVACADGSLRRLLMTSVGDDGGASSTVSSTQLQVFQVEEKNLLTSCCRVPNTNALVCSAQGGNLSQLDCTSGNILRQWKGHDFDAWAVSNLSLDVAGGQRVSVTWDLVSGGDDGYARGWDLRQESAAWSKRHDAGVVTAAAASPTQFFVGSYDESVYVYDTRQLKTALSSVQVGGGAWRIRPAPQYGGLWCVAAMQGGCVLLSYDGVKGEFLELGRTPATEKTLIYDAWMDFGPMNISQSPAGEPEKEREGEAGPPNGHSSFVLMTCSFYEKTINLFSVNVKESP